MRTRATAGRRAFTLIELLVVIGIVGVLVALLVPAVQKGREAAGRIACRNNLRMVGFGFHQHHNNYGVFPSNGGWMPPQKIPATDGTLFIPSSTQIAFQQVTWYYGVGDPSLPPAKQTGSWAFAILPYVEQDNVFRARDWTKGVKTYICPGRRTADPQIVHDDQFGRYAGGGWAWGKTDYAANGWLIRGRPYCDSMSVVTDGTSNTILVGEKGLGPAVYATGSWYYDEPFFLGGSYGTRRRGDGIDQDRDGFIWVNGWGSRHPAGAGFVFADGSVRSLSYSTSGTVAHALLTPNGGEAVPD